MTYDPNIPNSSQVFSDWQLPMLNNFTVLFNAFAVNHIQMYSQNQTSTVEQGKHTIIQMLSGSGDLETNNTQVNVYTEVDINKISQLFVKFSNNSNHTQYTCFGNIDDGVSLSMRTSIPGNFNFISQKFAVSGNPTTVIYNSKFPKILSIILLPDNEGNPSCVMSYQIINNCSFKVFFTKIVSNGPQVPLVIPKYFYVQVFLEGTENV